MIFESSVRSLGKKNKSNDVIIDPSIVLEEVRTYEYYWVRVPSFTCKDDITLLIVAQATIASSYYRRYVPREAYRLQKLDYRYCCSARANFLSYQNLSSLIAFASRKICLPVRCA